MQLVGPSIGAYLKRDRFSETDLICEIDMLYESDSISIDACGALLNCYENQIRILVETGALEVKSELDESGNLVTFFYPKRNEITLNEGESVSVGVSTGYDRSCITLKEKEGQIDITEGVTLIREETLDLLGRLLPGKSKHNFPGDGNQYKETTCLIKKNQVYKADIYGKLTYLYTITDSSAELRCYLEWVSYFEKILLRLDATVIDKLLTIEKPQYYNGVDFDLETYKDALIEAYHNLVKYGYVEDYRGELIKRFYPETEDERVTERIRKMTLERRS